MMTWHNCQEWGRVQAGSIRTLEGQVETQSRSKLKLFWKSKATLRTCSHKKVFWKYAANLQENTHAEVRFQ